MYKATDMVHTGDKIEVSGSCYGYGRVHILAQTQSNLFTLIDLKDGNRICDPFPCKYGTRLRSGNMSGDEVQMYGSFSLSDLHDAVASQSGEIGGDIGERMADKYKYRIVERFCSEGVFDRLAEAWNKMEGKKP